MHRRAAIAVTLGLASAGAVDLHAEAPGGANVPGVFGDLSPSEREQDAELHRRFWRMLERVQVDAPAREAFAAWSRTTGVPIMINWDALAGEGLDSQTPISLDLRHVTARQALLMMTQAAAPDQDMVYERTPWYVEVITKRQADRRLVVRVYDVQDLLHDIPRVEDTLGSDDNSATGGTRGNGGGSRGSGASGGRGSGRSGSGSTSSRSGSASTSGVSGNTGGAASPAEKAEEIATLLRGVLEPDIWVENGGQSSIRYYQGRLVIRAPLYVHGQIGDAVAEWPQGVIRHRPPTTTQPAATRPAETRPTGR